MAHDVTFIPGDGTGPELTEATRRVLEATAKTSTGTIGTDAAVFEATRAADRDRGRQT